MKSVSNRPGHVAARLRIVTSTMTAASLPVCIMALLLLPASRLPLFAAGEEDPASVEQKIKLIIREFSERLGIIHKIGISIEHGNRHLGSAQCTSRRGDLYHISFEPEFLRTLDERELNAAIAHELGHIWIYTHFPYLQTETLANRQALKLVSRSDLARVYEKVWKYSGKKGNLENVLGPSD